MRRKLITSLGLMAAVGLASVAQGAVVYVTNANVGWTISRTTSSAQPSSGDYRTFAYDGTTTSGAAVVETSYSTGFWTAKNDSRLSTAQWIGMHSGDGVTTADPFSTRYVYQGSFTLSATSLLKLAFAGDNIVDSLVLSSQANGGGTVFGNFINTVTPIGTQSAGDGRIYGFYQKNIQTLDAQASGTVYITATLYNYGGPPAPPNYVNGSAYGFILAVDATAAPLPSAAWGGVGCLAVLGAGVWLKRRMVCRA